MRTAFQMLFALIWGWLTIQANCMHDLDFENTGGIFIPANAYSNFEDLYDIHSNGLLGKREPEAADLPKDLAELATEGDVDYKIGVNCLFTASGTAAERKLTAKPCPEKLTVDYVIKHFYEDSNEVDTKTKKFLQTDKIEFESVTIKSESLDFAGKGIGESYEHPQTMLKFEDVTLTQLLLPRGKKQSELTLKALNFTLQGQFNELSATVQSKQDMEDIEISMKTSQMDLTKFMSYWNIRLSELADNEIGFTTNSFQTLKIVDGTYKGVFSKNESFQMVTSFKSTDPDAFTEHGANVYFIINKIVEKPIRSAILVQNPTIVKIEGQLPKNVDYQYSDAEFSKSLTNPWVLSASDDTIILLNNTDLRKMFESVIPESTVPKSINIFMQINMKEALSKCDASSLKSKSPAIGKSGDGKIMIMLALTVSGLKYQLPPSLNADLPALMKCVDKADSNLPVGLFGKYRSPFEFKEILYNRHTGMKKIVAIFPKEINLFGPVNVSNIEVTISKDDADSAWSFEGNIPFKIGPNITVGLTITADTEKSITANLKIPAISVESAAMAFGADPFGDPWIKPFKPYLNPGVKNFIVDIETTLGEPGSGTLTMSGTPVINGYSHVTLACFVWTPLAIDNTPEEAGDEESEEAVEGNRVSTALVKRDEEGAKKPKKGFAMGIVFKAVRLDRVISNMIGHNISCAWFSDATITIIASTAFKNHCTNPANQERDECKEEVESWKERAERKKKEKEELAARNAKEKEERDKLNPPKKPSGVDESEDSGKTEAQKMEEKEKKEKEEKEKEDAEKEKDEMKEKEDGDKKEEEPEVEPEEDEEKKEGEEGEEEEEITNPDDDEDDDDMKEGKHFKNIAELKEIPIKRGLQIRATFELPKNCKNDSLCKWLLDKVGTGAKIILIGEFTSRNILISAEINMNIKLNNNTELRNVKLELQAGAVDNKVEVSCSLVLKKPALTFTASIGISFSGSLEIGATMAGMWNKPFGVEKLAIGNLLLKIGITITGFPSFEIGATFWLGKITENAKTGEISADEAFKFQGYFGFDPSDVSKTYFYARSYGQNLTIGNIFKAFDIKTKLPQKVNETGFYNELKFSFNMAEEAKEISEFGISIPPGFSFKGELLFLNYSISCDTRYQKDTGAFYLDAKFGPIDNWAGGLITIVRSPDNRKDGPKFLIDIDPENAKRDIQIEGYMSIIGIKAYVNIVLSDSEMKFNATGDLWGVLKMQILVHAEYGSSAKFAFRGCLAFDIRQVMKAIEQALDQAIKSVENAFKNANTAMEAAAKRTEEGKNTVEGWKRDIESYKQRLEARAAELERKKAELDSESNNCKKNCGTVCVPFLDWKKECWKVWGYWVGCPSWNSCKWKAPNLICIAGCEIKKAFTKFAAWAEQIGIKIMLGLSRIGESLLSGVDALIDAAAAVVRATAAVVDFVGTVTKGILEAGKRVANFVGNLITIHEFCVFGNIDPLTKSCLGIHFNVDLIGVNHKFNGTVCLDLDIYKRLGTEAASKEVPEIKTIDKDLEEIEAKVKTVEDEEKSHNEEASKEKSNIDKELNDDNVKAKFSRKRAYVPNKEEVYYHDLAFKPLPTVNLFTDDTVSAMREAIPWKSHPQGAMMGVARSALSTAHDAEAFDREESSDSCKQHANVLSRYSTITHGFHSLMRAIENQQKGYNRQKRTYNAGLQHLDTLLKNTYRHNMTMGEKYEAGYWREYAEEHVTEYLDRAEKTMKSEKRNYVSNFRNQLSEVLEKHRGMKLASYLSHLHELAVNADKRSSVMEQPTQSDQLVKINKVLVFMATDDQSPLRELAKQVDYADSLLTSYKRSTIPCAA